MEIGFNPQFLTEALRVVDTDEISLELTAPNRPVCSRAGRIFCT
jgi:DNA polymerase III sliding clamp (beta) subunit (PCNA family)